MKPKKPQPKPEVIFQMQYPNGSRLKLRIVMVPPTIPNLSEDPDFILELSEENSATDEPVWRKPTKEEAESNVRRLTALFACAVLRERGIKK